VWNVVCTAKILIGQRFQIQQGAHPGEVEWLGLYETPVAPLPKWVVQGHAIPSLQLSLKEQILNI
jgi:hypothetical protein